MTWEYIIPGLGQPSDESFQVTACALVTVGVAVTPRPTRSSVMAWSCAGVTWVGVPDGLFMGGMVGNGGRDPDADGELIGPPWTVQPASSITETAAAVMMVAGRMGVLLFSIKGNRASVDTTGGSRWSAKGVRMSLSVERISVGSMDNNVYLVTDSASGERLLVDAAADRDAIASLVGGGNLRWLLTTHSHHDHIGALAAVATAHPEATVICGDADADAVSAATGVLIGHRLHDGDTVALGGFALDVIGLRGHTVGSVALAVPVDGVVNLITGDSLFPGGVGNTGHDPVRFASLLGDVTARIFDRYDDVTIVWPGHGRPTTLGAERPHLDEWRARGW